MKKERRPVVHHNHKSGNQAGQQRHFHYIKRATRAASSSDVLAPAPVATVSPMMGGAR